MKNIGRSTRRFALWCGLVILLMAPGLGYSKGRFLLNELKLKGEITSVVAEDINRDGLKDLMVIHVCRLTETPERWVTILWQDKAAGFDLKRSYSFQPASEVAMIDLGQAHGKSGLDLVCLCESGVKYYPFAGDSFGPLTALLDDRSVAALSNPAALQYDNFFQDWNGDGQDDLLLYQFDRARLYLGGPDGLDSSAAQNLAIRPWTDNILVAGVKGDAAGQKDLLGISYFFPRVYAKDWDGDGKKDLIAVGRKNVRVFPQSQDGSYSNKLVKNYSVKVFSPAEEQDSPRPLYPPNLSFADIDQDGTMDVVAQQLLGFLGKMKSKVHLYWGRAGSLAAGKPDLVFEPEGLAIPPSIFDVNKDGRLDLVIPTMALGITSVGRIFITGTFPIALNYYLQTKDHSFNSKPDYIQTVNLSFDLDRFRLAGGVPVIFGDFNGDGYPDDIVGKSKDLLEVTIKDASGKPTAEREEISVPVSAVPVLEDLNNDKKSDIILNYVDDLEHQGQLRILINQGPW